LRLIGSIEEIVGRNDKSRRDITIKMKIEKNGGRRRKDRDY